MLTQDGKGRYFYCDVGRSYLFRNGKVRHYIVMLIGHAQAGMGKVGICILM